MRYPNLFKFFGGYFHQDWDLTAGTPEEIVDVFKREAPAETVEGAKAELDALLGGELSEPELRHVLFDELDCNYNPAGDGKTAVEWLRQVSASLSE
jgi:phenylalanyl-tRNA synthetase beta subunit